MIWIQVTVWFSVTMLVSVNKVTVHQVQLVVTTQCMTVCGWVNHPEHCVTSGQWPPRTT